MKSVLRYLGYILMFSSVLYLIPAVTAIIYLEPSNIFFWAMIISFVAGFVIARASEIMKIVSRDTTFKLDLQHGLILTALSYISIALIGMIPYLTLFKGDYFHIITNSFFESVSGFTTTGLTVITIAIEAVPRSMLIWRSLTQWVGGIGIIVVFVFILSQIRVSGSKSKSESNLAKTQSALYQSAGYYKKIEPNIRQSAMMILKIYGVYTFLGIVALTVVGLSLFESINVTFTALSTGGFFIKDSFYSAWPVLIVTMALMILGATSFAVHSDIFKKRIKEAFKSIELRIFLGLVVFSIAVSLFVIKDFKLVLFQIISAFTTTGFSLTAVSNLPVLLLFFMTSAMIIGGSMASTAGGIKLARVYTAIKSVPWVIKKLSHPSNAIIPFKLNKETVDDEIVLVTQIFISCYFLFLFFGILILMLLGYGFFDSAFQIVSALGTVGLQTTSINAMPFIGKGLLILYMFFGRLEIFPVLVLLRKIAFRK